MTDFQFSQFGTLLVLQAAHQSPALRGFTEDYVLGELISKTINWLDSLGPISPALRRDSEILHNAAEKLDFQVQMYR